MEKHSLALFYPVSNCKKQNLKAQEELYNKFSGILFAVCLKYSPNYHEAEDNLQDAFLTIFDLDGFLTGISITSIVKYDVPPPSQPKHSDNSSLSLTRPVPEL